MTGLAHARDRLAAAPRATSLADLAGDPLVAWAEILIRYDLAGKTWRAVKRGKASWIAAFRPAPKQLELDL